MTVVPAPAHGAASQRDAGGDATTSRSGGRRGYADTAGGQMHYREAGTGPPLVLIHQALRSSLEFRRVMPYLSDTWRVIAVDLMGYGDSDHPPSAYLVGTHADRVAELVDRLALGPVAVGGHHTGANVALELAARYPEKVTALVLSGPAVVIGDEERAALVEKMSAIRYPEPQADGSHLMPIWREGLFSSFDVPRLPASDPEMLADFFLEQIKVGPRRKEAHIAAFSHDALSCASRLRVPALVMIGTEDMWACARGRELSAQLPESELHEVGMAGEMPRLDPQRFADTVRTFLERAR